jgi:hypothetical protein
LDVLCRFWEQQINDFSILVKEIQEYLEGRGEKTVYLSLPRPGKHGTTSKGLRILILICYLFKNLFFSWF